MSFDLTTHFGQLVGASKASVPQGELHTVHMAESIKHGQPYSTTHLHAAGSAGWAQRTWGCRALGQPAPKPYAPQPSPQIVLSAQLSGCEG